LIHRSSITAAILRDGQDNPEVVKQPGDLCLLPVVMTPVSFHDEVWNTTIPLPRGEVRSWRAGGAASPRACGGPWHGQNGE